MATGDVMEFLKKHKDKLKAIFTVLLLIASIFILKREIHNIDIKFLEEIFRTKNTYTLILCLILGSVAFAGSFVYDFYLTKDTGLAKRKVFEIAWISQSFSFFIGMFGITGAYLRQDLYRERGIEGKKSLQIALNVTASTVIGLFFVSVLSIVPLYRIGKTVFIPFIIVLFLLGIGYIYMDKVFDLLKRPKPEYLDDLSRKKRVSLAGLSIVDWLMAAGYFVFCIRIFAGNVPILTVGLIYITCVVIGLLSMIPGGFGSFDSSVIILFAKLGVESEKILPALILFRIGYYIIPFFIASILLLKKKLRTGSGTESFVREKNIRKVLALLVVFVSVILILSATTPSLIDRSKILAHLMPLRLIEFSKRFTVLLGIVLGILSRGINKGLRKTYYATVVISLLVAVFCIFKGLDYEEAIILFILSAILTANKKVFVEPAPEINSKSGFKIILTTLALILVYIVVYNLIFKVNFFTSTARFSLAYLGDNLHKVIFYTVLASFISIVLIFSTKYYENEIEISKEDWDDFEAIRGKYKNTPYTHLFYMRDKNIYVNKDKNLFFIYRAYKSHVFVLGDPVGEKSAVEEGLDEFSMKLLQEDKILSFYEISAEYLEEFVEAGFNFLKLGEDALIDLKTFNMEGKSRKNMRHIYNNIDNMGLNFKIYNPPHDDGLIDELDKISKSWLGKKKELSYSLGAFDRGYLDHCKIYTLEDSEGNIKAFANDLEIKNSNILTIDMMRYYRDGEESMMEMLLLEIILWAKEQGYDYFDLGIAPLSNVGTKYYSPTMEKIVHMAYNYGNRIYGFKGLMKYKEKFKPDWRNVYLAYRDETKLAEILFYLVKVVHTLDDEEQ